MIRSIVFMAAATAAATFMNVAEAQTYPSRPVRLVVGFATGGANDIVGRILAQKLTEDMNQQIVVDNRPGADGLIANAMVAKSTAPDGYTVLLVPASFSYATYVMKDPPYLPARDFANISLIAKAPFILLASNSTPVSGVADLVKLAKGQRQALSYATGGVGNLTHLAGELLNKMAGIELQPIPYKGTGPALVDLMGGQIPLQMAAILSTVPLVSSGKVKALGVTSLKRSQVLPDVPTISEGGLNGYEAVGWWALVAPRGLPDAIVSTLNRAIGTALGGPAIRDKFLAQGAEPEPTSPQALATHLAQETKKWTRLIQDANIQLNP